MPTPLINWCRLTVTPLSAATEPLDNLAGQATRRRVYGAAVTLEAQLDWVDTQNRTRDGFAGSAPLSVAVATVRERDARNAGYAPRMGDLVTTITTRDGSVEDTRLYVTAANKRGQWSGRYSTWIVQLSDQVPARRVAS
jgi:hypothetical protein